jgi:positive regulator of sigma E activity
VVTNAGLTNLIEVVTNACLIVFNFFSVRHYEKRFNAQNSGLEPTMYCTRGEHVDHYTTDAII